MTIRDPRTIDFLTGSRQFLAKLERECARLEASTERGEQRDHATNCALTAWHLIDWAWFDIVQARKYAEGKPVRQAPLANIRVSDLPDDCRKFTTWILQHCPKMAVCGIFASASKHGGDSFSDIPASAFSVGTYAGPDRDWSNPDDLSWLNDPENKWLPSYQFAWGDKVQPATDYFRDIVAFWRSFLTDRAIGW